jgi:hypothetical protein
MSWFRRKGKSTSSTPAPAEAQRATLQHFGDFARTRRGVEAYIEPATHVTQTTMVLIATTGEWTRRRVPSGAIARQVAQSLRIPVYDVNQTGYPQQMREWNAAQRTGRPKP